MNAKTTTGIVLGRINFGEADRILTIITPEYGKLRLMAKGVRKEKSKLAGGIELFSISDISFIPGKKDIGTLISTRLVTHYGSIVENIDRTTAAYNFLKLMDDVTDEACEAEYYQVLLRSLAALNNRDLSIVLCESWFYMQILDLSGHMPNLKTDNNGARLEPNNNYQFDFDNMAFFVAEQGIYSDRHIKLMRLLASEQPGKIGTIAGAEQILEDLEGLLKSLIKLFTS